LLLNLVMGVEGGGGSLGWKFSGRGPESKDNPEECLVGIVGDFFIGLVMLVRKCELRPAYLAV
jgi:hypothetical protein